MGCHVCGVVAHGHGHKNAIDDALEDAIAMLDTFHVVKLATQAVDDVMRRTQHDIHGHRGGKADPLYRIRNILRAGQENLPDRQRDRIEQAWAADERWPTVRNIRGRSVPAPAVRPDTAKSVRPSTRSGVGGRSPTTEPQRPTRPASTAGRDGSSRQATRSAAPTGPCARAAARRAMVWHATHST